MRVVRKIAVDFQGMRASPGGLLFMKVTLS
jgi:hypothetical protein